MPPHVALPSSLLLSLAVAATFLSPQPTQAAEPVQVGFAHADITPDVKAKPVWIAGYGNNRQATGVHDPIMIRTLVLRSGTSKIAIISLDLVGLQLPQTEAIRKQLPDYSYVLTTSTHNHEGPDVIGLWGPTEQQSGVDPAYLELVVSRSVQSVRDAEKTLKPAHARYGTATDDSLMRDSRLPIVKDGTLRALLFHAPDADPLSTHPLGLLVQWNCHPEHLGSQNTLLTADFPYYLIQKLAAKYNCPIVYVTGAVGGLMTGDSNRFNKPAGGFFREGEWEFAEIQGDALAQLTTQAIESATPIDLASSLAISRKQVTLPLANPGFRVARAIGVLPRPAYLWTGSYQNHGTEIDPQETQGDIALLTEVAYLRLGELHVACIPGEIYPELIVGKYQEPADPAADFPTAPLEPHTLKILPGPKVLIVGLANDEVGYILPKRQWDTQPPYAYNKEKPQYGEINSVGPETAPILMQALADCVRNAQLKP